MTTPAPLPPASDAPCTWTAQFLPAQLQIDAPSNLSLLEAAEMSRVQLPSSCRNGSCRTCMCQLQSGQVRYTTEWPGLSAEEHAQGWVLPCVAQAASDVVLHQPLARVG